MLQTSTPLFVTSRLRVGLGTFVAVDAEADSAARGSSALEAAFAAVARVEMLLHPTRDGSDLAAINAGTPGVPIAIHPWTWEILALSQRLHRLSRGTFDPCVPASKGTLADLELRRGDVTSVIVHAPLLLDLGGIGKGFAVDRGIDALRAAGCDGGLVNAGGDLAVFGTREHSLHCRDAHGATLAITLRNAALATSDVAGASRPSEHRGYYDGADGRPICGGRVAVTAPCAAVADALTKCLLAHAAAHSVLLATFGARRIDW